jgi:hypothetical protein
MKYRATNLCISVLTTIAAGLCTTTSSGQEDPNLNPDPFGPRRQEYNVEARTFEHVPPSGPTPLRSYAAAGLRERPIVHVLVPASTTIRSAADAVRDAKSDEDKAAARKKLADLLSKYFDDDMREREKELAKIEERLTKLRELQERRRTKKEEIVNLQAKVALNEAEGLGFYNTEPQTKMSGSGFGRTASTSNNRWIAVPEEAGEEIPVPQATTPLPPAPVKIAPPAAPAASKE